MAAILTYHHVCAPGAEGTKANLCVSPEAFDAQMRYLRESGAAVVGLDQLADGLAGRAALPKRAVAITFDDGYGDNFTAALPILKKHGFAATFFITTGWTGGRGRDGARCMSAEQLRGLAREGMTLGAHSVTHPRLGEIPIAEAEREMAESKRALEAVIEKPVRWLCYPSGSFSRDVAEAARRIGFAGACSVIRDNRCHAGQLFWLPRVMVMPDTSPRRFAYYLSPLYHWVHAMKNRKRWDGYL